MLIPPLFDRCKDASYSGACSVSRSLFWGSDTHEGVTVNSGVDVVGEIRFQVGSDPQRDWGCR